MSGGHPGHDHVYVSPRHERNERELSAWREIGRELIDVDCVCVDRHEMRDHGMIGEYACVYCRAKELLQKGDS